MKTFNNFSILIIFFVLAGAIAAFISLAMHSVLVSVFREKAFSLITENNPLVIGAVLEELSKLLALLGLAFFLSRDFFNKRMLAGAGFLLFGFGFAFFEFLLIFLNSSRVDSSLIYYYLPAFLVHLATSLLLGFAVIIGVNLNKYLFCLILLIFFLFSVIIHIAFNMFAVS